jgi:hypothetical protein
MREYESEFSDVKNVLKNVDTEQDQGSSAQGICEEGRGLCFPHPADRVGHRRSPRASWGALPSCFSWSAEVD